LVGLNDEVFDRQTWSISRLMQPTQQELFPAPRAIERFFAGTIVDDRLWLLAQVGGISKSETAWRLVSTADGETWDSLGDSVGLPAFDVAPVLSRTGDNWTIITQREDAKGASNATISWSNDGRHWQPADVPDLHSNVGYLRAASIGDTTVLLGYGFDMPEGGRWLILRSTDGRTWERSRFALASSVVARDVACNERMCVIAVSADPPLASTQGFMVSNDGDSWAEVNVETQSAYAEMTIGNLTTTDKGFIALSGRPAQAILSEDGLSWRTVDVLPPGNDDYISNVVVAGDMIAALVPWQTIADPNRLWVGSLAAMGT
jgi:hypothetical protein